MFNISAQNDQYNMKNNRNKRKEKLVGEVSK